MRDIKQIVKGLKKKYNTNDPYILCEKLKINIIYARLGAINGYYMNVLKHNMIHLNQDLDINKRKFVCAHELGHYILHRGLNIFFLQGNTLSITGKYERQANIFAAELLIENSLLCEYEGCDLDTISTCENIDKKYLELKFNK